MHEQSFLSVDLPAIKRDLGLCLFFNISCLSLLLLCTHRNGSNQTNDTTNEDEGVIQTLTDCAGYQDEKSSVEIATAQCQRDDEPLRCRRK